MSEKTAKTGAMEPQPRPKVEGSPLDGAVIWQKPKALARVVGAGSAIISLKEIKNEEVFLCLDDFRNRHS